MQHEKKRRRNKNPCKSIQYLAIEPIKPGHTCERPLSPPTGCPEVSFATELPQYVVACSPEMSHPPENLKNLYHINVF